MTDSDEFPVKGTMDEYRKAYEAGNQELCKRLREQWKEWQGEDNLHETVFGEP